VGTLDEPALHLALHLALCPTLFAPEVQATGHVLQVPQEWSDSEMPRLECGSVSVYLAQETCEGWCPFSESYRQQWCSVLEEASG